MQCFIDNKQYFILNCKSNRYLIIQRGKDVETEMLSCSKHVTTKERMFPLPKQYLPVNNLSFHFLKSMQNYVKENENQVFREREVFIMQLHLSLISPSFRHKAKISPIIRARHKAEFILM